MADNLDGAGVHGFMSNPPRKTLIFGATSAIAAEVAVVCARRGDRLYLFGRNPEKMQALLVRSPGESKIKYQKSSLTDVDIKSTLERLKILVEQEKIYLIEDLRLPDLAKALGLNRTQLSELLNSHFQKNFANFINEYRVEEAKKLLADVPGQNILDIAFATGFGSKAAFSNEFKRVTGMTAKEFREQIAKKRS